MSFLHLWRSAKHGGRQCRKSRAGREESGASLVEYALLLALIAVVAIGALIYLGDSTSNTLNEVAASINSHTAPGSQQGGTTTTTTPNTGLITDTGSVSQPNVEAPGGGFTLTSSVTDSGTHYVVYQASPPSGLYQDGTTIGVLNDAKAGNYTVSVVATEYTGTNCEYYDGTYTDYPSCQAVASTSTQTVYIQVDLVINSGTYCIVAGGATAQVTTNAPNSDTVTFTAGSADGSKISLSTAGTLSAVSGNYFANPYSITNITAKDTTANLTSASVTITVNVYTYCP